MQEAMAEAWALVESGGWAEISTIGHGSARWRSASSSAARPRTLPATVLVPYLPETVDPAGFMDEVAAGTLLVREALCALPHPLRAVIALQMDGFSRSRDRRMSGHHGPAGTGQAQEEPARSLPENSPTWNGGSSREFISPIPG